MGILNFELKFGRKVLKYVVQNKNFFLVNQFPTYGWLSNFRHCMGGG